MSTEYGLANGVALYEQSNKLRFTVETDAGYMASNEFTPDELQEAIVAAIKVLSYHAADDQAVLDRFNVTYQDVM